MIAVAIEGIGAVAFCAGLGITWVLIETPAGKRNKPHRPPWWRRWREERAQERAQDALNLRLLQDITNGLRGEATRAATSPMPRAEPPLKPLPPGVEEYADHFHRPMPLPPEMESGDTSFGAGSYTPAPEMQVPLHAGPLMPLPPEVKHEPLPTLAEIRERAEARAARGVGISFEGFDAEPEDPHDVATDDEQADAYVGPAGQPGKNGSDEAGLIGPLCAKSLPSPAPDPEPAPLTDYRASTGSWEAIRDDVLAEAGGE